MIWGLSVVSGGLLVANGVATGGSAAIYFLARRRQDTLSDRKFTRFVLCVTAWNALSIVTYLTPGRVPVLVFDTVQSIVALTAAFLWIEFVISYTGYGDWLTRNRRVLLWSEPIIYSAYRCYTILDPAVRKTMVVGQFDGLSYAVTTAATPLQFVWVVVPFAIVGVSYVLLMEFVLRTRGGYRKQAGTIFLSSFSVYACLVAYYGIVGDGGIGFNPTPALNAVMATLVALALFKFDFLNITPLATDLLFEEMPDPVFVISPAGKIVNANEAAKSLRDDELEEQPLTKVLPTLASAYEKNERTTSGTDDAENLVTISVDEELDRTFDLSVSTMTDPYDSVLGHLLVLRDVTGRVEREQELERRNEHLEQFTSVVSHDLRNPLQVAYGSTDRAYKTGNTDALERSLSALENMEALIDDLLTLAQQGKTIDETEWVDLECTATMAWPFLSDEATLVVESTGRIKADRSRLSELLGNCFRNAHEHGGQGVTVWVGTTVDGWYVEDDGPGIPEDERETVFNSGYTTSESGTGFGLSIVANIAKAHGWSVSIEDGRDGGAKFVLSGMTVQKAPSS